MTRGAHAAAELLKHWGVELDQEMLVLALTHRSFANERGKIPTNERLEFLGDAVLQLIVTDKLFHTYPDHPEGHLAKMRAATVSQTPLAQVARTLNLGDYLLLGRGEEKTGGRDKDSILSDTVEALIGATYLSHGMETTRVIVEKHLAKLLADVEVRGASMDFKTRIQEICQLLEIGPVIYEVDSSGPDHQRQFSARLLIDGKLWGSGEGRSKKTAEHQAAQHALDALTQHYHLSGVEGFDEVVVAKTGA